MNQQMRLKSYTMNKRENSFLEDKFLFLWEIRLNYISKKGKRKVMGITRNQSIVKNAYPQYGYSTALNHFHICRNVMYMHSK